LLFYLDTGESISVAFVASKKIGKAVDRNFAKRRMRSLFYLYRDKLKKGSYIFVAKHIIHEKEFSTLSKEFKVLLNKRFNSD